jgi:hypothetical protein
VGKPIVISIIANGSQANATLERTASTAQKISSGFRRAAPAAIGALAAIGVGAKSAIDAASDLEESVSKAGQIFGKQTPQIEKFAANAEQALGQSRAQALEAASTFGIIGQSAGLSAGETAAFSQEFTTLASDLASFNNTSPEEAITAIGAAMRGESEPIRRYGVLLDDATLRNRALKMGLIDNVKTALTPQQKALAASREILAQTTKAQGDFARTSDGAANKSRVLAAQQENLRAKLGEQLLPIYVRFQTILSSVLTFLGQHQGAVQTVVVVLAVLAGGVLAVNAAMAVGSAVTAVYTAATTLWAAKARAAAVAQMVLNGALLANPVGLVIAGIVALAAVFVLAWRRSSTFRAVVTGALNGVKRAGAAVMSFLRGLPGRIRGVFSSAGSWLRSAGNKIVQGLIDGIGAMFGAVKNKLGSLTSKLTSWKGPPKRDAKILRPAGSLIIDGFIDGITDRERALKKKLGDVTRTVERGVRPSAAAFASGKPKATLAPVAYLGGPGHGGDIHVHLKVEDHQTEEQWGAKLARAIRKAKRKGLVPAS